MDEAVRLAATLREVAVLDVCGKLSMLRMKGVLKSRGSFSYLWDIQVRFHKKLIHLC